MRKDILESQKIADTLAKLCLRIEDRFPGSGLLGVARTLYDVSLETDETILWIRKPNYIYRSLAVIFVIAVLATLGYAISELEFKTEFGLSEFVSVSEAAVNELLLISAAVLFIGTQEARRKRNRVIAAVNQLRSIAHVIDAHQLTKDPDASLSPVTKNSPPRPLTPYQLERYLDYCSELLALTSKVAFLYVQWFDDPVAVKAVNDLEGLTSSLSAKVWQKIMILDAKIRPA